jgi:hypothetical protein
MSNGLLEITHNHLNLGTGFIDNISGGTIRVGGTFMAAANVFQPTGGTVEFVAYSGGGSPYIDLTTGNWMHNLMMNGNTTWLLGGAGPSQLTVNQDVTINSGGLNGSDDIIYLGDDWTNNMGAGGPTGETLITGTPFDVQNQMILTQGTFALSASAPLVTVASLM